MEDTGIYIPECTIKTKDDRGTVVGLGEDVEGIS